MEIVGGKLVKSNFVPSECSLQIKDSVCSGKTLDKVAAAIGVEPKLEKIKEVLGVEAESEIYKHPDVVKKIGSAQAMAVLENNFNPPGPYNNNSWLSNVHLDSKQEQYAKHSTQLFKKKYTYCPFQMIDFAEVGGELTQIDIVDISKRYDCFGVIFNTDYSSGRGIHWFCSYIDFTSDPIAIEYFNSSGGPPKPQVSDWMHKIKTQLLLSNRDAQIIIVPKRQLQYSNSECGVWSLMYIQSRLEGKPPSYFEDNSALDSDMLTFRSNLFRWS